MPRVSSLQYSRLYKEKETETVANGYTRKTKNVCGNAALLVRSEWWLPSALMINNFLDFYFAKVSPIAVKLHHERKYFITQVQRI